MPFTAIEWTACLYKDVSLLKLIPTTPKEIDKTLAGKKIKEFTQRKQINSREIS